MKENIETKDVQRTEYLDKNGLDMLWAKVKENTQNQVEVERDRATTQENRIIDTKADKSELHSSYVSNSTFTALQEKVAANTDAISDKQDVGNYLSYETLNNEGYYEIPYIRIPGSGGSTKTDIDSQSISVNCDYPASHTTITCDGISNTDNNANHVYATDGSIADLTQYVKKSEITAGGNVDDVQVNGVSVVENKIANIKPATKEELGVVKIGDGLNVTDGTVSVDTTAIGAGNYLPYERYTSGGGYDLPYNNDFWVKKTVDNYITSTVISPGRVIVHGNQYDLYLGQNTTGCGVSVDYGSKIHSYLNYDSLIIYHYINNERYIGAKLNKEGIFLLDGDNNHVLTSHGSTIDITQYVLKSVYDEKIAALEARIAALEAKHAETA